MDFGKEGTIPRTPLIAVAPWSKELIVSHIIECPACSTRYRMNKPIPEGGRSVKCARCGHQWRLAPESTEEEADIPAIEEQSQAGEAEQRDPFDRAADYMRQARGADAASEAGHEPDEERQATDWLARRDHHAAAISTLSQPDFAGYEQPSAPDTAESYAEPEADAEAERETDAGISADSHAEDEPEAPREPAAESWWQRFRSNAKFGSQPEAEPEPQPEAAEEDDSDRFSASDFDFGNERADEPDEREGQPDERRFAEEPATLPPAFGANAKSGSEPSWPEFSATAWRETSPPAPDVAEPDFEEAEAEIREALRSALENPAESEAEAFPKADTRDTGGESDWRSRWNLGSTDKADEAAPQTERFSFANRFDADTDAEEDEPSPFRLTGKTVKFPVFGVRDRADEEDDADPRSPDFEDDIEDTYRPGAAPKRTGMAEAGAFDDREPASDFGSVFEERFARGSDEGEFLGDDFDDEAAALQQRFESTDLAEYQRARSYGGLAIAAAWAVFFSIISGIALAFVSFRQDIMAALPGTRSLYHTLGFAVADNPVDFSDVSYRWTTVEGKPMIEVTGQVVNVTERTVKVPRVLVNVRDGASRGPVQATANVQADSLAPKESANFTLEFVSPSKDISQIELEFDENR